MAPVSGHVYEGAPGLARLADVTQGTNALFGGSCCPTRLGYDLATGWGSTAADVVVSSLVRP